jgi:hypothetical protein
MIFSIFLIILIKENLQSFYINISLFPLLTIMSSFPVREHEARDHVLAAIEQPNDLQVEQSLGSKDLEDHQGHRMEIRQESQESLPANQNLGDQQGQQAAQRTEYQQGPPAGNDLENSPNPPNPNIAFRRNIWGNIINRACSLLIFLAVIVAQILISVRINDPEPNDTIVKCIDETFHYTALTVTSIILLLNTYVLIRVLWNSSTSARERENLFTADSQNSNRSKFLMDVAALIYAFSLFFFVWEKAKIVFFFALAIRVVVMLLNF